MTDTMTDPAAIFSRDLLVALAEHGVIPVTVRTLLFAVERADAEGVALFDEGELAELLGTDKRVAREAVRTLVFLGRALPCSTRHRVILNPECIRAVPVTLPGARFGSLTLLHRIDEGRWFAECDCGHRTAFSEAHLLAGLASHACIVTRRAA